VRCVNEMKIRGIMRVWVVIDRYDKKRGKSACLLMLKAFFHLALA
jgi:hypothetical protein